jgi:hypothetical protein
VGGAGKTSGKRLERIEIYVLIGGMLGWAQAPKGANPKSSAFENPTLTLSAEPSSIYAGHLAHVTFRVEMKGAYTKEYMVTADGTASHAVVERFRPIGSNLYVANAAVGHRTAGTIRFVARGMTPVQEAGARLANPCSTTRSCRISSISL